MNQKLFNHMAENHGLILLQTELQEIIDIVNRIVKETPYCPYCGHKKGYKVLTDINSGKECKNPLCKKQ